MKQYWLRSDMVNRIALGFLLLPFLIFVLTFLKLGIGLPIAAFLVWMSLRAWNQLNTDDAGTCFSMHELLLGTFLLILWVFLSGIGGYAFQNADHLTRNTIFSDLINHPWPVYYFPIPNVNYESTTALIYYIGYWLPAALIGKVFGWQAGNIALFLWTLLGIFLTTAILKRQIRSTLTKAALLLVFFSGMDIIGALIISSISPNYYPTIWPPITAIEFWVAGSFQFSSFTTQLFWVFNQAIPTWVAMALILNYKKPKLVFLIWALCFFNAPIPAIGLLPFTLLIIPNKFLNAENISLKVDLHKTRASLINALVDIKSVITLENTIGGGIVLLVSILYFSANPNGTKISLVIDNTLIYMFYIIFLLFEVLLLWILFFKEQRHNLWWYVAGASFIVIPLIRLGTFTDFCMRASIPALFMLMVWSGEALYRKSHVKYRGALITILIIGAITPLYEINRSLYRTGAYYLDASTHSQIITIPESIRSEIVLPEYAHPSTLNAGVRPSVMDLNPDVIPNYIGDIENSFFFGYLAKPP